jgi:hypothetical protein
MTVAAHAPRRAPDLKPGDTFGRWTVTGPSYMRNRRRLVPVTCECDTTRAVRASSLLNGESSGCGTCSPRRPPSVFVKPGDTFGELTVLKTGLRTGQTPDKPAGWRAALCACSCGRSKTIAVSKLVSGKTVSCGHSRPARGRAPRPRKPATQTARARVYAYIAERGAARAGEVAAALGLTVGSAGGHLSWLAAKGHLTRRGRGVYVRPGVIPAELPPPPSMSEAVAKRNRTVAERRRASGC